MMVGLSHPMDLNFVETQPVFMKTDRLKTGWVSMKFKSMGVTEPHHHVNSILGTSFVDSPKTGRFDLKILNFNFFEK
jgi:hypothetical protein